MNFAGVFSGIGVNIGAQIAPSLLSQGLVTAAPSFLSTLGSQLLTGTINAGLNIGTGLAIQAIRGDGGGGNQTVQQALAGQANPGQPYQNQPQTIVVQQPASNGNSSIDPKILLGIGGLILLAVLLK